MRVFVDGVAVNGPGLPDWEHACRVLSGCAPYTAAPAVMPAAPQLPAGERRRASLPIKFAVDLAAQAAAHAQADPEELGVVFGSANGDLHTVHQICEALAQPEREVSPTRFHNSVHNASAGYWSIAVKAALASTSVAAQDDTFAAALLEGVMQVRAEGLSIMLAAYDVPGPPPLACACPTLAAFGVALVLRPAQTRMSRWWLEASVREGPPVATPMTVPELEGLRAGVAAARALPLLSAMAGQKPSNVDLAYAEDRRLHVELSPCA
ncbi:MAG: beta-ketoacyl synthase chain length factor [Betaproteobacteria bacterium]|nr:beta-ketoacyl synthase chain length factor [Betaproteobacteria bacterium]